MTLKNVANSADQHTPSAEDIKAIAMAVENMYHQMVSIYQLQGRIIEEMGRDCSFVDCVVTTQAVAQACARRLDLCATKLNGVKSGYYENEREFGTI